MRQAPHQQSRLLDALCIAGGVALVLAACLILSHGRILWEDEVLGLALISDPSWSHMLREWSLGADNGGLLFYTSARLWINIFGYTATAFRMYAATGFAAAYATLFLALRPYFSRLNLTVAILAVWFIGPGVVVHICEGRFYGLFLFAAVLTFAATLQHTKPARASVLLLLVTFLANGMLITSHLLGLVYSATLLTGLIAYNVLRKRPLQPLAYCSYLLPWLLLIPQYTAIHSALNVGTPHYWTTRPNLHRLLGAYHAFDANLNRALLLLALTTAIAWWRNRNIIHGQFRQRTELYVVTLALAIVPLLFFAESYIGPSIFVDRYLLPITIVPIVFAGECLRLLDLTATQPRTIKRIATACVLALLVAWIFLRLPRSIPQRHDYTQALTAAFPPNSAVVLPDGLAYTEVIARQYNGPVQYHYLLNWSRVIDRAAPRADVSQFHLLSGWLHAGYYPGSVQPQDAFVQSHPNFFVVETRFNEEDPDPAATETVLATLARQPNTTVQPYPSVNLPGIENHIWQVCHGPCPTTP